MGYCVTTPEREKVRQKKLTCTQKTASREIFSYCVKTSQEKRSQAPELHQANHLTTTKIASGIPYWPSRDPIEERGGINLFTYALNDSLNKFDLLGLKPKCVVALELAHGSNHQLIRHKNRMNKCSQALGLIGCTGQTDKWNKELIEAGVGIPGIPMNGGNNIGVNAGNGPNFPGGRGGFIQLVQAAWDAAIEKADVICNDSAKCCETVKVQMTCSKTDGVSTAAESYRTGRPLSSFAIMKKTNLANEWCGKIENLDCVRN